MNSAQGSAQRLAIAPMIAATVGVNQVYPWEAVEQRWKRCICQATAPDQEVACMVLPATVEELAAVVTVAHQHNLPILPCGNGSKLDWGGLVDNSGSTKAAPWIIVSTQRLNRLIDHAVGDLTVTVEVGMKFAELQAILAKAGQFLAIDPTYPDQATIGGIIATADAGSLRHRYNSVRDMLLGISFVRADGQIAKAGGRVVKNVAGYDLMKLFTGSYGTLGILTQVTFRVYPLPNASQTMVLSGNRTAIAQLAQTILQSALTPSSLDLISASVMESLHLGHGIGLVVRFQSILPSVQEQIRKLTDFSQMLSVSHVLLTDADEAALWQRLRERMTAPLEVEAIACKIGIQPSQAMVLLEQINSLPGWHGQIHAASGLGRLWTSEISSAFKAIASLRAICQEHHGFLSILKAPVAVKQQLDVWGYHGNALDVMRQIKHQFDPNHLLSPHRFVGGI